MGIKKINVAVNGKKYSINMRVPDDATDEQIYDTIKSMSPVALKKMIQNQAPKITKNEDYRETVPGRPYSILGSLKQSFAGGDLKTRVKSLQGIYGEDNVSFIDGGLSIKTDKGWQMIDQPGLGRGTVMAKALEALHDVGDIAPEAIRLASQYGGMQAGALIGGGGAIVAGQAGPQAATLEEVATVPAGAIMGGKIGGGIGRGVGQLAVEGIGNLLGVRDIGAKKSLTAS